MGRPIYLPDSGIDMWAYDMPADLPQWLYEQVEAEVLRLEGRDTPTLRAIVRNRIIGAWENGDLDHDDPSTVQAVAEHIASRLDPTP